jgi:hypothetical protein
MNGGHLEIEIEAEKHRTKVLFYLHYSQTHVFYARSGVFDNDDYETLLL